MKILWTAFVLLGVAVLPGCVPYQTVRGGATEVIPLYPMASPTGLRVQIFASATRESAERIANQARGAFAEPVSVDYSYPYFKVRVGNCANRAYAEALKKQAACVGYRDAFIVSSPVAQNYPAAPPCANPPVPGIPIRTRTAVYQPAPASYAVHPVTPTPAPPHRRPDPVSNSNIGYASWYGSECHGRATASGEVYDMHGLTAASRTLPFGTRVLVTNLANQKSVVVRINDRGPAPKNVSIDLSYAAAEKIGSVEQGVAKVRLDILR